MGTAAEGGEGATPTGGPSESHRRDMRSAGLPAGAPSPGAAGEVRTYTRAVTRSLAIVPTREAAATPTCATPSTREDTPAIWPVTTLPRPAASRSTALRLRRA